MEATSSIDPELEFTSTGVNSSKLGMWIFLASEVMFFTGLIGSYIVLRLGSDTWPDPSQHLATSVLAINTFVLICSSLSMVLGLQAISQGDQKKLTKYLLITILLGTTFLVIKVADYVHMIHNNFTITSSLFGSCYYFLTGFHGLHVAGGIVTLVVVLIMAKKGRFSKSHYDMVECTGLYWHFVDLVWIILFAILCLV